MIQAWRSIIDRISQPIVGLKKLLTPNIHNRFLMEVVGYCSGIRALSIS